MDKFWIARDIDGGLLLFYSEDAPVKDSSDWVSDNGECIDMPKDNYPEVTWESGPLEVKVVPKDAIDRVVEKYIKRILQFEFLTEDEILEDLRKNNYGL